MDQDGLPIVGAGVDYSKVDPFHQKRTLTFLNHFLTHTTSFLNHFSAICDEKLENLLGRIQRLEASMCILEAKLTSIPGLDDITLSNKSSPTEAGGSQVQSNFEVTETPHAQIQLEGLSVDNLDVKNPEPEKPKIKISQDSRFSKYFKMVNMGVLREAVKQKMESEGVNPDILDDPDAEAPPNDQAVSQESNDNYDTKDFID